MRLQPEALGDLKIRMSLEPGKVEASFEVQSDQARKLLGTSMDSLRSALEARGLEVARLNVQVAEPPCPTDAGQSFGGADAHGGRSGSEHPGTDDAARTPREVAAESVTEERPWMGQITGGALRLDALA
jgi:flagellar hook-length control protein FliK